MGEHPFVVRGPLEKYDGHIEAKWTFEPKDCFESTQRFEPRPGIVITIEPGSATAELAGASGGQELRVRIAEAEALVRDLLTGASLLDRVPFELRSGPLIVYSPEGTASHHALLVGTELTTQIGRVDFVYSNAEGVVRDTKKDRIERKHQLSTLIAKHRSSDPTLGRMLDGIDAARRDRADELVHLGVVFEAFQTRVRASDFATFKSHETACERLRILCNDSRLRQGRHRGLTPEQPLRDATQDELDEARTLAQRLVEAYLEWLDSEGERP
jgi:hypothetical protein